MAFDLYITFSGLCMLVRRPDELLVLLPHTHDGDHKHVAVFGSHRRYQPEAAGGTPFVEHELGRGVVSLDDLDADSKLRTNLQGFEIADITGCVSPVQNPGAIFAQIVVNQGAPCPREVCEQHHGAYWNFRDPENHGSVKRQRLATALHWRIRDVREEVDGREGLMVRVTPSSGQPYDVTLRPSGGQLRMYVFHTLPDEKPSSGPPHPRPIKNGEKAPHFEHYFELFDGKPSEECLPEFAGDTEEARDGEKFMQFNFVGRRYSCVMATIDDPEGR
ncbi:MAG TPA: hypothetical protein VGC13_24330 [Longimicrobium sp.]|jgi:hypothetical protein|uniref:hypothetical protein n=1 Tax=Longimicrobium sp. TaxID=2029185 RepID=UPI002EDA3CA4